MKKSKTKIAETGECFETVLEGIEEIAGAKSAKDTRATVTDVVRACVDAYQGAFGGSDVGATGTGEVTRRFEPSSSKPVAEGTNGLLYGRVQSGKTNVSIATLALARDNGFRCFVVLTSDNTWLGEQTADRFAEQLSVDGPVVFRWEDWKEDPKTFGRRRMKDYLATDGVVLVSTKNSSHLEKLVEVLKAAKCRDVPALIVDDEADNASLDTQEASRARGNDVDPSKIFTLIGNLRKAAPNHVFLQVTATPQSLLLQHLEHPARPRFAILSEPGSGYIGGGVFFSEGSKHVVEVDSRELDDLRSGRVNPGQAWLMPKGLRHAVCCFLVGAASKWMLSKRRAVYSMLVHIDHRRINHGHVADVLDNFLTELDQSIRGARSKSKNKDAKTWLEAAHKELARTEKALKPLDELIPFLEKRLRNARPEIINANNPNKKPNFRPGFNFIVGGNRLGRGVTIDGLTITYYGRDAKQKMMDTVHQHARMFGYRESLLGVTRLFSAPQILSAFRAIYEADEGTREAVISADGHALDTKPVWLGPRLRPTRSNVLNPNNLKAVVGGRQLWPRFLRTRKSDLRKRLGELEERLGGMMDGDYHEVPISSLVDILALMPSDYDPTYLWEDERIREALENLPRMKDEIRDGIVQVSRRKNGKGYRATKLGQMGSGFVSGQQVLDAKRLYPKRPVLLLRYQEGRKDDGWNDHPFYAPTLLFPRTDSVFVFTFEG